MIESGDKRIDVRFVRSARRALQMHTDPRFKGFKICSEDFVVEFMGKKMIDLRRNWAVGFSILELSKFVMSSLYYKVIRPSFGDQVSLLFTDTDSFGLLLPAASARQAMEALSPVMDFSNLSENDPLYSPARRNKVGYLKNETPKSCITRFVGLKAKTYAFTTEDLNLESKCKGVKKAARKQIKFDEYLECIRETKIHRVTQYGINSKNHVNRLIKMDKTAFSSFDDKRYLLCAIHSVPYGSLLIDYQQRNNGVCYFCQNPSKLY